MSKIFATILLSFRSLALHKLRSGLTILGIVFGVASVITMLAVGEGTSSAAQESIRQLGSNNIIIDSIKKADDDQSGYVINYGITYTDLERIKESIPNIKSMVRQRFYEGEVRFTQYTEDAQVVACDEALFKSKNIKIGKGRALSEFDLINKNNVCVIDGALAKKLFPYQDPLNHKISFDRSHYQVVGIIASTKGLQKSNDYKVYIPFSSAVSNYGELTIKRSTGSYEYDKVDVHQLIIELPDTPAVYSAYRRLDRLMNFGHKIDDFSIKVPIELLEKAAETKRIFSMLLGSIAGISLLVGGIGIMNIMLATVSERTKEIGLRRAIGAKKKDIVIQFMTEAIVLSFIGGLVGVLLGVLLPFIITQGFGVETVVSPFSVIVAFLISGVTGIIFGSYPAIKSANLSPIDALKDM
ncbi:ABC transporter permease [Akkermansiaceae bacterium]|nr:ABC transporter permease [Akkermansiaceae bacterium]